MGYDATTLGNHEFDLGPDGLGKPIDVASKSGRQLAANMGDVLAQLDTGPEAFASASRENGGVMLRSREKPWTLEIRAYPCRFSSMARYVIENALSRRGYFVR